MGALADAGWDQPVSDFLLCQANGPRNDWGQINDALKGMGYPMSDRRVEQVNVYGDANVTVKTRSMERSRHEAERIHADTDFAFVDWEGWDHHAADSLNTQDQHHVKQELFGRIRERGAKAGIYGDPYFNIMGDHPISVTSLGNFRRYRPQPDVLLMVMYLTRHLGTPEDTVRLATNTHMAIRYFQATAPQTEIVLLHQPFVRHPRTHARDELTDTESWSLGRLIASTGKRLCWWHEDLYSDGRSMRDMVLRAAEHSAGPFMDGYNSIGIRRPRSAGRPKGRD